MGLVKMGVVEHAVELSHSCISGSWHTCVDELFFMPIQIDIIGVNWHDLGGSLTIFHALTSYILPDFACFFLTLAASRHHLNWTRGGTGVLHLVAIVHHLKSSYLRCLQLTLL
jgi:hypothetical protein